MKIKFYTKKYIPLSNLKKAKKETNHQYTMQGKLGQPQT